MKQFKNRFQMSLQQITNTLLTVALIFLLTYIFYWKNDKMAYVDANKIITQYKGALYAKKGYDQKIRSWQSNIDTLSLDFQNTLKKYEKELAVMSEKERQLSKQLLATKQKQLADYQKAIEENSRQEDAKLYQGVVTDVNAFLLKYGEEHDYKMILIANQSGTIAYARKGLDITENVLEDLNNEYKGK